MTYNHAYTCALVYGLHGDFSSLALGSIRHKNLAQDGLIHGYMKQLVTYFGGLLR